MGSWTCQNLFILFVSYVYLALSSCINGEEINYSMDLREKDILLSLKLWPMRGTANPLTAGSLTVHYTGRSLIRERKLIDSSTTRVCACALAFSPIMHFTHFMQTSWLTTRISQIFWTTGGKLGYSIYQLWSKVT